MCTTCANPLDCSCFNDSLRKEKKQQQDRAVKAVLTALNKHRIPHCKTHVDNVVAIPLADTSRVLLSLKSHRDEQGYVVYKYRPETSPKWLELRRDAFLTWLTPLIVLTINTIQSTELMPFGKYKGKHVSYVATKDKEYCQWVLSKVAGHVKLKERISMLL
jgi:uncharacterized protein (DUF3820 family)